MKQFTLKSLMLLLLLLIGGGSSAWGEDFVKVTSAPDSWEGSYLFVYEAGNVCFDGSLTTLDVANNTKKVTIKEGVIAATDELKACCFTVTADSQNKGWYQIKSASNFYIAGTVTTHKPQNGIASTNKEDQASNYLNRFEVDGKGVSVYSQSKDGETVLRFNKAKDQQRFRYYKTGQEPIALYKLSSTATLTSIAVSGTPTNKTYFDGEAFDPTGLVVTGTYDDGTQKEITDGIVWVKDPEILKLGTTSVDVMASVGNITSDIYTVKGITVKEKVTLIAIEAKGTPAEFWKGDKFNHDGITITARWSDKSETDVTSDCKFTEPDMNTAGKKTVTVTYENKTCTYEIEVKTIENTKETAYTVSEAKKWIDAGKDLATQVYVKGIVSKIDSYNDTYKSITYWLDDNTFQVYSGKGLDGKDFTSKDDIEIGANVIICGKIKKFNDNTYEFDKENYLVEYKAPVEKVLKSIAISGEATKTTYTEGEVFDPTGLVVTATYEDESTEVVTSRVEWTFNPETLAVGTTSVEVMASIGSDAISDVYIVNGITVKEKVILVGNSIVVAEDTKNSKWVAMSTSNINGDKTDYFESVDLVKVGDKYITTGKLDDILFYVNTVDGKTSIQNPADNKYVQATGAKKVSYTEKEYLWSNNGEQLAAAQTAHGTLQYNVGYPRFTTYASKSGQYATIVDKSNVYEGAEIALSGTDGTHYFTTFSSDKAVEFVDATVYTVGVNENKLSLNEVKGNQVPANTGVLVQSNETNAMYVYIESAPAIEGNLLRASVTEQTTTGADDTKEYKYYMLSYNKDNENLGFYWGENDGAAFTSKAGRAYLAVEKTNEVAAVKGFSLSDMETGISQVCGSAANNGVIYDLQGRRVERAVRGLYIMNGRKVMVK